MKISVVAAIFLLTITVCSCAGGSSSPGTGPSPQPISAGAQPPLVYNFWAQPSTIVKGGSARLNWNVLGAASVRIDPSVGSVQTTGSINVAPSSSTTFTLTATGAGGNVQATEEVHVLPPAPVVPAINWFAASPSTILAGNSATLSWHTTNAQSVTITGIGPVAKSGTRLVAPLSTTRYVLEATTSTGRFQDAATVEVVSISPTVYYEVYQVQPEYVPQLVPEQPDYGPGGGGYSGADGDTVPASQPGGGGYSGADGDTGTGSQDSVNWTPPPDEEH